MKHFLSILDTPTPALTAMLLRSVQLRIRTNAQGLLAGKTLACLFQKPSLRTRVSFEQAMRRLGGEALSLGQNEVGVGQRESAEDISRVLSGMVDAVMARVVSHETLVRLARVSVVPVINGLSEIEHPAQALADVLTLMDEFSPGDPLGLAGRVVAFVGDGNNVARSLAVLCARLGMEFVMCAPPGFDLPPAWIDDVRARIPGARLSSIGTPPDAVRRADAIYCDTFVSMGQESERASRLRAFEGYQVSDALLAGAPGHTVVLHCLPAHRGEEITDSVMDGPRSRVFRQAHNRVDAQMGLLAELLAPSDGAHANG
ncbi:MAG: ornithine carbamoyltransferase [Phycisphaeraceae bacterium]|nr:ornithine carbamoyltransferase [Phycisphaeraceae bacterium]